MSPIFARLLSICTVIGVAVFGGISAAHAAPGDSIALYLSAPLVQGSDVTGAGSSTETFDSMTGVTQLQSMSLKKHWAQSHQSLVA